MKKHHYYWLLSVNVLGILMPMGCTSIPLSELGYYPQLRDAWLGQVLDPAKHYQPVERPIDDQVSYSYPGSCSMHGFLMEKLQYQENNLELYVYAARTAMGLMDIIFRKPGSWKSSWPLEHLGVVLVQKSGDSRHLVAEKIYLSDIEKGSEYLKPIADRPGIETHGYGRNPMSPASEYVNPLRPEYVKIIGDKLRFRLPDFREGLYDEFDLSVLKSED
jgi:hypothetical protein